ncbi:MAG: M16 family metallopeptidase [Candidatus Methylomirabilales bacterium]
MRSAFRRVGLIWSSLVFVLAMPAPSALGADVVRATLKNGLQVVIVRNTLAPVVTTQINYLVGSDEAPAGFPGMAHALEHMMFRGSPGLSAAQLSTIGAAMGGDFNAGTQQTVTQYFFTVPAEDLDIALRIESIRMRGILATQKIWGLERGAIEQEVAQDLSNPQYVFYTKLLDAMYAGTPYAHDALGTRESFDRTTGAMLRNFHGTWYASNNAILVIVGDVEPDATLAKVKRLFEGIPRRPLPPRPVINLPPLAPGTITLETDLPYGLAVVAYRLPGYDSPDFAAGQVLAGPGQSAGESVRTGSGRDGALYPLRRPRAAEGRAGVRHGRLSPRGRRFCFGREHQGHHRRLRHEGRSGGSRGGGKTSRDCGRRVREELGGGAGQRLVPGHCRGGADLPRR